MQIYVQPVFNVPVNIWRGVTPPPALPALTVMGNLSPGRVVSGPNPEGLGVGNGIGPMWLRLPAGTDIQDTKNAGVADIVEVGAGSGRFYTVAWVDDIGGGFQNEHRFAILNGLGPWPIPFPTVGSIMPATPITIDSYATFSSGAVPVFTFTSGNIVCNTAHDYVIWYAVVYDNIGVRPTAACRLQPQNFFLPGALGPVAFGGHTAELFNILDLQGIGNSNVTVLWPLLSSGLIDIIGFRVRCSTGFHNPLGPGGTGVGTPSTIAAGWFAAVAPWAETDAFVLLNQVGVPAFTAPLVLLGAPVARVIGLVNGTFAAGGWINPALAAVLSAYGLGGPPAAWQGIQVGLAN